ncbi:glutaredoxin family protein [Aquibacillus sp. 3ASR75-11]|uniref:Glutaredoxin family protein n=1 Tax=Terrihalobacillus insolitus TaxID=2950438 RepID=A0A9X3WNN9_9BACI|nr:glutaredoxin family protein [Terrihalobacillus insolitus]MDC3412287.1 glutaredoxin family protein [Terrihalobacillus insolitus]MDC3423020.1 glutaredoxin family protein [Terrihalobacillus insolitus]
MQVILYTKNNCSLCDEAKELLQLLQAKHPFELKEVNIYQDDALLEKYQIMIPVVEVNGKEIDSGIISLLTIEEALKEAH